MLTRVLLTLLIIICSVAPVHAKITETFAPGYDFCKNKKIFVVLSLPENLEDKAVRKELKDVFYSRVKKELKDKLPAEKYTVDSFYKVLKDVGEENVTEAQIAALFSPAAEPEKKSEAWEKTVTDYLKANYDVGVLVIPQAYEVRSEYVQGYIYTVPETTTYQVVDANGKWRTITITRDRIVERPSGYFPAPYCKFYLAALDTSTWHRVWERTDERMRINDSGYTKPKSMFGRITTDFTVSLRKFLKGEKKPKVNQPVKISSQEPEKEHRDVGF